jgi:hypothetical protein
MKPSTAKVAELEAKVPFKLSIKEMQEMIFQKGTNWNDFDQGLKRGRLIMRVEAQKQVKADEFIVADEWQAHGAPIFTQDRTVLDRLIPDLDPREPVGLEEI